jgi:hypothetical protein
MSILPQESRTPAVVHTVMEFPKTLCSQSISYTRVTRVAGEVKPRSDCARRRAAPRDVARRR